MELITIYSTTYPLAIAPYGALGINFLKTNNSKKTTTSNKCFVWTPHSILSIILCYTSYFFPQYKLLLQFEVMPIPGLNIKNAKQACMKPGQRIYRRRHHKLFITLLHRNLSCCYSNEGYICMIVDTCANVSLLAPSSFPAVNWEWHDIRGLCNYYNNWYWRLSISIKLK